MLPNVGAHCRCTQGTQPAAAMPVQISPPHDTPRHQRPRRARVRAALRAIALRLPLLRPALAIMAARFFPYFPLSLRYTFCLLATTYPYLPPLDETDGLTYLRVGVVSALSTLHPYALTRICNVLADTPVRSAHSAIVSASPAYAQRALRRVLRACCDRVAHRQLPGAYGPSLSIRSTE